MAAEKRRRKEFAPAAVGVGPAGAAVGGKMADGRARQ
jgi:hypothetical protein